MGLTHDDPGLGDAARDLKNGGKKQGSVGQSTQAPSKRQGRLTLLCGRTEAPLMKSSSLIATSSPRTVMFSTRAHRPTDEFQPMMELMTQA